MIIYLRGARRTSQPVQSVISPGVQPSLILILIPAAPRRARVRAVCAVCAARGTLGVSVVGGHLANLCNLWCCNWKSGRYWQGIKHSQYRLYIEFRMVHGTNPHYAAGLLLQIAVIMGLQGVAPQPNATNHTPSPHPAPGGGPERMDETPLEQWFHDQWHQILISGGAVALIVLAACVVMHLRDRRRMSDYSEPSEPLWSLQGAE